MKQQGAWTRWENVVDRKVTWAELWKAESHRIKFLFQAAYNVLPTTNLHTWGLGETPACPLCSKRGTLEQILSSCTRALGDGRYRWRHDQVLDHRWSHQLRTCVGKTVPTLQENYHLCQSWGAVNPCRKNMCMNPNLCKRLAAVGGSWASAEVSPATLQSPPCDQTLSLCLSPASKFVLLELIVPWEDRLEEAFERKLSKDAGLVPLTVSRLVGEQGVSRRRLDAGVCSLFPGQSIQLFGHRGGERMRRAIHSTSDAAERPSRWLWLKRGEPWSHGS